MISTQSKFTTFGWWVAWIYLLSIAGSFMLAPLPVPPDLPFIEFVEDGITVTDEDGVVREEVTATVKLSKKAESPINVTIEFKDLTAKLHKHYEVRPEARTVRFERGEDHKTISFGHTGRNVEIVEPAERPARGVLGDNVESLSFKACIVDNQALEPVGLKGELPVTILRREWLEPSGQPRATFVEPMVKVEEKALPGAPIGVRFDKPLPEKSTVYVDLFRVSGIDGDTLEEKVDTAERTVGPGEQGMDVLQIGSLFSGQALEKHRVVDDLNPEADEHYELRLRSSDLLTPPPLSLTALNDDGDLQVRTVSRDEGRAIDLVDNGPDWPEAEDRWWRLTGTTPDGESIDLGTHRTGSRVPLPDDMFTKCKGRSISYDVAHCDRPAGQGRCQKNGCESCAGGGCPEGQCGEGKCGAGKALCGPTVPGDYMLIVVNNERLHERGDGIVDRVREALKDKAAQPYGNAAIIVNPKDEDSMTAEGGGPKQDKMFQPFEREEEDVAAQQKRVEEVIARKREAAERPDLRAVVVWPERDLASGGGLKPVAGPEQQPVSFLFPGADPSYARNMRPLVPPKAKPGVVTIRSPKEGELTQHLINVMRESREKQPNAPKAGGSEDSPAGDIEAALRQSTG
ncbi:MAG: hypothetical protein ACKOZU_07150 [Planctomycetaceae bacterium]